MCISYSGRCLLSNFLTGRDANRGDCAQSCRWQYALVEQKRPGEYFPIEEDQRGSYILGSKDLCLIEHIPVLVDAGVSSLKIEGRMKSINYVAGVVQAYRQAIDAYTRDPQNYQFNSDWMENQPGQPPGLYDRVFIRPPARQASIIKGKYIDAVMFLLA